MNIKLEETQILNILTAIRSELINSKIYYENYTNEENRIGVTSPEEWTQIYNSILDQAHQEDKLTLLVQFFSISLVNKPTKDIFLCLTKTIKMHTLLLIQPQRKLIMKPDY